ncbi:hypothetical protein [Dehalococcoides mccartyi]|uniref:hypothetical protein n=1 Tax=Dehalococcoides mccartyi TaxID=61435 RepID=UPI0007505BB4|nr:hypothetical protein [Dehalococcoides mccartyi]
MTPQVSVMSGSLGDIFWDLPPWMTYTPGFDLGCSIYVANPTGVEKEYALMARLSRESTLISEEALPVFGYAWFKVSPADFVRLRGALRFSESDADLSVLLVERETEEVTDSAATRLVAPQGTSALPPTWPGAPGTTETGFNWNSLLSMMFPVMMLGVVAVAARPQKDKVESKAVVEPQKLLSEGRNR